MTNWVEACRFDDIEREGARRFDHGGRTYALFRSPDDTVYCTDGLCSHGKAHLAGGHVMDHEVECPRHSGAFDYRTGKAVRLPPCIDLATYETRVENGIVRIAID